MPLFGKKQVKKQQPDMEQMVPIPDPDPSWLRKNNILLLSIDERWTGLFTGKNLPPALQVQQNAMNAVIKREAQVRQELEQMEPVKKRAMQQIMRLTKEAFDEGNESAKKALQDRRNEIESINLRWSALMEEADAITESLRTANLQLLKDTVNHVFTTMHQARVRLPEIQENIRRTEAELERLKRERAAFELDWAVLSEPFSRLYGTNYVQTLETLFAEDIQVVRSLLNPPAAVQEAVKPGPHMKQGDKPTEEQTAGKGTETEERDNGEE